MPFINKSYNVDAAAAAEASIQAAAAGLAGKKYQVVIGLEVHIHLRTASKIFCRCENFFGGKPNTRICPVCTGQPGVLPVVNKNAISLAVKAALALECSINEISIFARKQYFYPDMPKNYQISQYEMPLAINGEINIKDKKISITRVHLEEDAGKLLHINENSFVDLNRAGTALLEIVSEPEINTPSDAGEYLRELRKIMKYCGISDCDMEKGSLRCDANISLRKNSAAPLGTKAEVKNLNSFRAVEKALEYEIKRQEQLLAQGERIIQETRLWDDKNKRTISMRSKEEAHDYRYFPEPDLPPLIIEKKWIDEIRKEIPELPAEKRKRYMRDYKLSYYDADALTSEKEVADYFETAAKCVSVEKIKKLANWITVELMAKINAGGMSAAGAKSIDFRKQPIKADYIAQLVNLIEDGTISGKMAKEVFEIMWDSRKPPDEIIKEKGMKQITSDEIIESLCRKIIDENREIVNKFLSGKTGVFGALVGKIMKETRGQANPRLVNEILKQLIRDIVEKREP